MPSKTVKPDARILTATPLTIWLPRWVIQAKPCSKASKIEPPIPAIRPIQAELVKAATVAAAKAAASILPSRPISMTPDRSTTRPARAQRISGTETRMVASSVNITSSRPSSILRPPPILAPPGPYRGAPPGRAAYSSGRRKTAPQGPGLLRSGPV